MNTYSPTESIRFGWETFKRRPFFILVVHMLSMSISQLVILPMQFTMFLVLLLGALLKFPEVLIGFFIGVVGFVSFVAVMALSFLLQIGEMNIFLHAKSRLDSLRIEDMWVPRYFWKYLGTVLLSSVCTFFGFLLFVIPGIILMTGWIFAVFLVIDRDLRPVAALRESWRITRGNKWRVFLLLLLILLINLLGALCFFVGLFVTTPVSILAMAHAYRTLEAKTTS